ncbi:MAG: undecaprenyl/decaprenyl-phosphate alpha-N-acetylglucosaminyl 1-phosphate transferase, partial [Muribaculaceae bacterium]|nr:undecaprenyl/decaprenyl-phosphate alpha-N-acetylglucosaminyl 1-phosphate transferase [Muribaculaceae bacterium]
PFLYYNVFGSAKRGKKIFMGDTGSLTIGMAIVFLAINVTSCEFADETLTTVNPMVVAFAPLIIPLFDVARVTYRRLRMRRNPFMPDRTHIHHKLLALGLTPAAALTAILTAALVMMAVNVLLSTCININILLLIDIVVWIIANLILTRAIRRRERRLGKNLYI